MANELKNRNSIVEKCAILAAIWRKEKHAGHDTPGMAVQLCDVLEETLLCTEKEICKNG